MIPDTLALLEPANHPSGRWYGLYPAVVSDNQDPDGQGRVKVRLPWAPDGSAAYDAWARTSTMMAGNDRGSWFVPDVDDEVLVGFGGGNPDHPYVLGALWNGKDDPPAKMDSRNTVKRIRSRNGVQVTWDDTSGQESLVLETPGGQRLTLKDGPGTVKVEDSNGNSATFASSGITVQAAAVVKVTAAKVDVQAAMVSVVAPMSTFSGVVQVDTLIANTVVSAAYTPGAGNVW